MNKKPRYLVHGALIAALYVMLTHLQNILLPNSVSMAIQFRASEALCVLAFFTPAAIPGLTIGCFLFNISFIGALPLDFLVGSLASCFAATAMWLTRNVQVKNYPLVGMLMPALFNAVLVGWELSVYIGNFDISSEQQTELQTLLSSLEYDDYDRLIQLCDCLAGTEGVMDMEQRMLDVKQRYGFYRQDKWDTNLWLRQYFEEKAGQSIYEIVK